MSLMTFIEKVEEVFYDRGDSVTYFVIKQLFGWGKLKNLLVIGMPLLRN